MIEFVDVKTVRGVNWQVVRNRLQLQVSHLGTLGTFDLARRLPSPIHLPPWPSDPLMVQTAVLLEREGWKQKAVWIPGLLTEVLLASSMQKVERRRQEVRRIRLAFIRQEPCLLFESILMPALLVDQFPIPFRKIVGS